MHKSKEPMKAQPNHLKVEVTIKSAYGRDLIYPHCDKSKVFAQMMNTKTLTPFHLQSIRQLGYEVVAVQPVLKLPE